MFLDENHDLFQAYVENRLVIFVGAGLSSEFGLPTWTKLSSNLLDEAKKLGYINQEYSNNDAKTVISRVKESFKENNDLVNFNEILVKELTLKDVYKEKLLNGSNNYYSMLYKFFNRNNNGFHGLFVTTNADLCLDYFLETEKGIVNKPEELNPNFEQNILYHFRDEKIIHLHGSIKDLDSLVFTSEEYTKRYSNEEYKKLLNIIFNEFTVLFIGYSLSDYELESFLKSADKKHYLLKDYSSKNIEEITNLEQKSKYTYLNIELIPFEIEEKSNNRYINLFNKIEELMLNKELIEKPFDEQQSIINLIKDDYFTNRKIEYIKNIFYDRKYSRFFINQLIHEDIPQKWYELLLDNDLLNIENNNVNPELMVRFLFLISNKEYIKTECAESFQKVVEHLLNFRPNIHFYYLSLIFKILLNMDNEHFTKRYAKESFEIFRDNNKFIQYSELKEMLIKINKKNFKDILNNYYEYIFDFEIEYDFVKYNLDKDFLINFLKEYLDEISSYDKKNITKILIKKFKLILEKNNPYITLIFNIDGDKFYNNQDYGHAIVKCLITSLKRIENNYYIEKFYKSESSLLNRIAYYFIDENYSSLNYIMWNNNKNPLNALFKYEFAIFLDHIKSNLGDTETNKVIIWINQYNNSDDSFKKYLLECLDKTNPNVIKELNKLDSTIKSYNPYDNIQYQGEMYAIQPIYLSDLRNRSNQDIIRYISNEELNKWELKESFRNLLSLESNRFEDIFDFKELSIEFQKIIISKLNDDAIFKNIKNHDNILDYFYELNLYESSNYKGILKYLKKYMSLEQINEEKISKLLIKYMDILKKYSMYYGQLDFNFRNDSLSLLYDNIFYYLIQSQFINSPIKKFVINLFNENPHNEFKYYLGRYTPIFYVNNENFQNNNLIKILKQYNNDSNFLRGLLENYGAITEELYEYLNGNNPLKLDIIQIIVNSDVRRYTKSIVHFIIFNYLYRNKHSLLHNFMNNKRNEELSEIIDSITPKHVNNLTYDNFIMLWKKIINLNPDAEILNKLNVWIENLDKIDETSYNLLKKSVPYIDKTNYYDILEYYTELVDNSLNYVGKLLLKQNIFCSNPNLDIILIKLEELEPKIGNLLIKKVEEIDPHVYNLFKNRKI